ncbi:MAG: DMT family transporter, partial [Hyphomicrobiaceae bacterium]
LSIVLGSLSYAASAIYGPRFRQMGPLLPAIASLLLSSLVLIPLAAVVERPWTATPTLQSLGALLAVGLLGTALGNVLYFRLLGTLGTISTTSQAYLRVPIGVLVSVLVLGETLSSSGVLGLICVVVGVAAMTIPKGAMVPMLTAVRTRFGQHFHLLPDYLLLLVLAVLWAGSYIWVKIGLASIPPLTLMLGRISVAALFLLMVLKVRGLSLPRDPLVWRRLAIQGVFTTVIPFSLVAWGQQWVDAGAAAILNSLAPMFVFLITWGVTRHEPANPLKLFGVMAGLSGVVVVIGPEALFGMGSEIIPPIALVVASLSYGLGAINSRHFRGSNPVVSATGAMLCAALILLPFALVIERPWTVSPTWSALGAMLAVGVLSTGCGFLIYFRLARTIGSLGVSTQSYLRAPIGVVLGALVLGETITSPLIAGMLLVVIGVGAMTMPAGSVVAGASKRA